MSGAGANRRPKRLVRGRLRLRLSCIGQLIVGERSAHGPPISPVRGRRLLPGERSGPLHVMLRVELIDGAEASLGTYAAIRKRARRLDEQNVYDAFDALLTTTFQMLAKEIRPAGTTAAQLPDSSATRGNR